MRVARGPDPPECDLGSKNSSSSPRNKARELRVCVRIPMGFHARLPYPQACCIYSSLASCHSPSDNNNVALPMLRCQQRSAALPAAAWHSVTATRSGASDRDDTPPDWVNLLLFFPVPLRFVQRITRD